ncbi:MAG: lactate utilization protein, partial [Bacteroidales bacterium]|nr:lactate utilization protein [Bacteroidales bacterium]
AMHMSKEDIAKLFHEKFDISDESSPEEITLFVRKLLREKFINADAGITGANFLIADIGAVAITENEGNAMLTFSMPRIHIVVAGIEKIIPSMEDLHLFWPLLASHGTGQGMTVYNSIVTGPRQDKETDGPEEMHVILIDNNRTEILKQEKQRRALSCIKCGACLNACPVYRNIGGHSYGTTYSGPIGAVITPFLRGMKNFKHLSFASTLCGKCTEVCPVNINLHELLLYNRNEAIRSKQVTFNEKVVMSGLKNVMQRRWLLDLPGQRSKKFAMNMFFKKSWGPGRTLPEVQPKTFKELWKEENEG